MIESAEDILKREFPLLPEHLQEQVWNFMLFLKWKHEKEKQAEVAQKPAFGCGSVKGLLAPDFDEPLEEFKDYMQ